jgi:two-component system, OmpR family, response regulator MprA
VMTLGTPIAAAANLSVALAVLAAAGRGREGLVGPAGRTCGLRALIDDREAESRRAFGPQRLETLFRPSTTLLYVVIYDRVWGYDFGPASNALRVYVGYLRRKLEGAGARQLIHTVRGVGYVLREP